MHTIKAFYHEKGIFQQAFQLRINRLRVHVQSIHDVLNAGVVNSCMAIPVLPREGGLLSNDALLDARTAEDADILGPSRDFMAPML